MGAGVAVGRQWAWPWSPGSLGPCPSGLLCSPGMLAPRSPAGTGCRSSSRSSTIQGPLPKGFTAQMAAVTGLHPDRLLQAATLPPHLQDQLSCKGPSRPASSPPRESAHTLSLRVGPVCFSRDPRAHSPNPRLTSQIQPIQSQVGQIIIIKKIRCLVAVCAVFTSIALFLPDFKAQ